MALGIDFLHSSLNIVIDKFIKIGDNLNSLNNDDVFLNQIIKIFHPTVKSSKTQWGKFFFHAILVINRDKSLNKLTKGFDVPTEQLILQQLICFCLNCSNKEVNVQPPAPVQLLVRLP